MPAKSKAQQRFMGMVHAVQKGELSPSKVSDKVKDVADNMSDSDAEDFASTKHKGKPEKVAKEVIRKVREVIKPIVEDWWAKASDKTKASYVKKHGSAPNTAKGDGEDDPADKKDATKAKFEKQAKGDFESAIDNGEGQWADEIVNMNSDYLPKGVQKDAQEALYAIQDAEMGMGGDADWAKDYLKKNVLPHIKVGEQSPEDAPTKLSTHEKEFIGDAEAVMKMDDPDAFDIRNAIEPFDDQGMDVSDLEDMADKLDKDKDSVDPDSVAKALGDIVSSYKKFGHSGPRENIKESAPRQQSYASMFDEFTRHMKSSYEVQAAKDLADEYDIGRVLYVFRTQRRSFDKHIKDKVKEKKAFLKAKKLKEALHPYKDFEQQDHKKEYDLNLGSFIKRYQMMLKFMKKYKEVPDKNKRPWAAAIRKKVGQSRFNGMIGDFELMQMYLKDFDKFRNLKDKYAWDIKGESVNEAVKDPKLKVGQKIRHKNDPRKVYTLKKITHGNRGIPEDPAGTSYMFVAPGNKKEFHTKKTWAQALKKKWIIPEGKRATKGFQKAFKTRKAFMEAMSDFRKKLGDMGTDPKIFKLEGELYKFDIEFQKKSAKLLDFMQKLAKSSITEGTINEIDYGNVFADMGDKLSDFKMKVVKPGMRLYNKGKAKFYMRDLYKSLEKCVDLCDMMNLMANESVVEQWRPYKPLLEKIIKIKKDPHKGVKNTAKGKRFNPLLLKGEDKIKALVWSGSHPTGKGSYELKGNKLNVMGLNPRDKGFYVSHFTKNTGIRRGNLYYDGVHWQGKKNF